MEEEEEEDVISYSIVKVMGTLEAVKTVAMYIYFLSDVRRCSAPVYNKFFLEKVYHKFSSTIV